MAFTQEQRLIHKKICALSKALDNSNLESLLTDIKDSLELQKETMPDKEYRGVIFIKDPDDKKKNIPIWEAVDTNTGKPCYFTDPELTNQIILNNEQMKETILGQNIVASPLIANEIPYEADGIVLCLDGTDQDIPALLKSTTVYADFIAAMTAKFPLPAGAAYGLSKISVEQFSGTPKRNVYCDVADAVQVVDKNTQVTTVGLGNTSLLTVGGRKPYGRALKPIEVVDTDGSCKVCNDIACELVDGDVTANGEVGNALQIDFCISCFATPA